VKTGVALKDSRGRHDRLEADLKALLQSAPAIYFPDPAKATAGIHFFKVLQALGPVRGRGQVQDLPERRHRHGSAGAGAGA
jgi:hypothetical protein